MTTPREAGPRRKRYRLAEARQERDWTQDRAADEIYKLGIRLKYPRDMLGVDARTVSGWERGVHDPKPHYARILCKLYAPVLQSIDPVAVSNRISLQTDMAAVLARQGDPEQSSTLLAESLSAANNAGLRERVKRIEGVRSGPLDRYRKHAAVRLLDDQLQSLRATTVPMQQ